MFVNLVGAVGTLVSVVMFWPQALRIRNLRHDRLALSGVSAWGQVGVLVNASTWLVYAAASRAWWSGAPGLVNIPVAAYCLWVLRCSREAHDGPDLPSRRCQICTADPTAASSHGWYVANAPGYGSVVFPCNGGMTIGFPVMITVESR